MKGWLKILQVAAELAYDLVTGKLEGPATVRVRDREGWTYRDPGHPGPCAAKPVVWS